MTLDFEKETLIKELKKRKPKKVLVQLAEGMKKNAPEIGGWIKELEIEVVFSGETCWGGCDIAVDEARAVKADLIVHFGHAEFMQIDFPVIYIEVKDILDLNSLLENLILVSIDGYENKMEEGMKIIGKIDEKDTQFIALALSIENDGIWSNDKHFEKQKKIKVFKAVDILKLLEELSKKGKE